MYEIWAWREFDIAVRGIQFSDLEIAKQFVEMCKICHEVMHIDIDKNGDRVLSIYKQNEEWKTAT